MRRLAVDLTLSAVRLIFKVRGAPRGIFGHFSLQLCLTCPFKPLRVCILRISLTTPSPISIMTLATSLNLNLFSPLATAKTINLPITLQLMFLAMPMTRLLLCVARGRGILRQGSVSTSRWAVAIVPKKTALSPTVKTTSENQSPTIYAVTSREASAKRAKANANLYMSRILQKTSNAMNLRLWRRRNRKSHFRSREESTRLSILPIWLPIRSMLTIPL